jgi:ABC-type antimicrobial peptide transport system permease subunit
MVVRRSIFSEELGIHTGTQLLFRFDNGPGTDDDVQIVLTVVGIITSQSEQSAFGDRYLVPPGALPSGIAPMNVITIAMVDESNDTYMDQLLISISDVPGAMAIEISALTDWLKGLIDQLKAIPTLVAWLALLAGTAIIANTVALATQERRRQIGVMKAVGLKGRRVLIMLMIENGLIGLIAGLIGLGVGLMITVIQVLTVEDPNELKQVIDFSTMGWLMLMSIGVSVGAAILSAWSAAAEKPMNVLRYE